jgi:hypothetical protein
MTQTKAATRSRNSEARHRSAGRVSRQSWLRSMCNSPPMMPAMQTDKSMAPPEEAASLSMQGAEVRTLAERLQVGHRTKDTGFASKSEHAYT